MDDTAGGAEEALGSGGGAVPGGVGTSGDPARSTVSSRLRTAQGVGVAGGCDTACGAGEAAIRCRTGLLAGPGKGDGGAGGG